MNNYDVIVIGSGTSGYNVAKECRKAGRSVAVVESSTPGGVCALHGCQPKKFFVVQAELMRTAQHLTGKGVAAPLALRWSDTAAFKNAFTEAVPGNTQAFFERIGASLYHGTARFEAPGIIRIGADTLQAGAVVLATGSSPRRLDIPGGELALDSNDFLAQEELPASIIFIGGGYISFEFAHVAAAYGARVTILNKSERVLGQFDSDLVTTAVAASEQAGIRVLNEQEPVEIVQTGAGQQVRCQNDDTHEAAAVFAAVGRQANLQDLNLGALGLAPDSRGLVVDETMRVTSQTNLYAVGDCARTVMLAPVADREAVIAAKNITGENLTMDYDTVPSVCFTQPPLAAVGLTEEQATQQGISFQIRRGEMTGWANQRRLGAQFGQFKLLVGEDGLILGAHILDHGAGDMINLISLAIKNKLPAKSLKEMMWAYPTLSSDVKYMA